MRSGRSSLVTRHVAGWPLPLGCCQHLRIPGRLLQMLDSSGHPRCVVPGFILSSEGTIASHSLSLCRVPSRPWLTPVSTGRTLSIENTTIVIQASINLHGLLHPNNSRKRRSSIRTRLSECQLSTHYAKYCPRTSGGCPAPAETPALPPPSITRRAANAKGGVGTILELIRRSPHMLSAAPKS